MLPSDIHQPSEQPIATSVGEAARLAGLSKSTIRRLISDGTLEVSRVRRRVLILRSSLQELLENGGAQ
jgi:excisionase family DNA binding protein